MAKLEAVIEISKNTPNRLWKMAHVRTGDFIRLWDGVLPDEIGSVVSELFYYNLPEDIAAPDTAEEFLNSILHKENLIVAGGLRAIDVERKLIINPGCCCGLEDWREWLAFAKGGTDPWLGHDPSPWIERMPGEYRVWSDSDEENKRESFSYVKFSLDEFHSNLQQVHQDLKNFLSKLFDWANAVAPNQAKEFVEKVDICFEITLPH